MDNHTLQVKYLKGITPQLFKEAIELARDGGIASVAPLGYAGETIILHEAKNKGGHSRSEEVSIRMHSGDVGLLITDKCGRFLFHGSYHIGMGVDFLVREYYRAYRKVRCEIKQSRLTRKDINTERTEKCSDRSHQVFYGF